MKTKAEATRLGYDFAVRALKDCKSSRFDGPLTGLFHHWHRLLDGMALIQEEALATEVLASFQRTVEKAGYNFTDIGG